MEAASQPARCGTVVHLSGLRSPRLAAPDSARPPSFHLSYSCTHSCTQVSGPRGQGAADARPRARSGRARQGEGGVRLRATDPDAVRSATYLRGCTASRARPAVGRASGTHSTFLRLERGVRIARLGALLPKLLRDFKAQQVPYHRFTLGRVVALVAVRPVGFGAPSLAAAFS